MNPLGFGQLRDLAEVADAEGRIEKTFDWYFERHKLAVQAVLAYSTALAVALLIAALREDIAWQPVLLIALVALGGPSVLGILAYLELRSLPNDYLEALALLDELKTDDAE